MYLAWKVMVAVCCWRKAASGGSERHWRAVRSTADMQQLGRHHDGLVNPRAGEMCDKAAQACALAGGSKHGNECEEEGCLLLAS